jgi:hypothetical protein
MIAIDIFPVEKAAVPPINAYELDTSENSISISGKLAYRLRKQFGGHWSANYGRILSDKPVTDQQLNDFLRQLWKSNNVSFRNVRSMRKAAGQGLSEIDIATFVAKGMLSEQNLQREMAALLNKNKIRIKNATIKRAVDFNAFVVDNLPSISISVSSNILLEQDLENFIRDGKDPMNLYVKVKHQSTKGEVIDVVGQLKNERERLESLAQDELTIRSIQSAADDTQVLTIRVGQNNYDYAASSLEIILTMQNCSRFNVSSSELSKHTKINPADRYKMVQTVRNLINEKQTNGKNIIGEAYNSAKNPVMFPHMFDLPFEEPVVIGKKQVYDFKSVKYGLKKYGLYKPSRQLVNNEIRVGVLYPNNFLEKIRVSKFLEATRSELESLSFKIIISKTLQFDLTDESDLEKNIDSLMKDRIDLVLCILPDYFDDDEDNEAHEIYHTFKRLTITRGIGGQVVNYKTLGNPYAIFNIILGILGKTGNIPFALSRPLEFCDVVVGIDIARQKKTHLPGSNNAAAIARVYFNDGNFLKYVIHDAPLEGETVPSTVMKSLFPLNEFQGKRVVVHRDGYFRGDEIDTLKTWGDSIKSGFSLIEVIKRETPRIYDISGDSIGAPKKGTVFMFDDKSSLVVSSPPPFPGVTPRPLKIRIRYGNIQMIQALRTILSLTELHYGSTNPPRLPVTIHYSDQIAWFALRGIKPPNLTGEIPFWL